MSHYHGYDQNQDQRQQYEYAPYDQNQLSNYRSAQAEIQATQNAGVQSQANFQLRQQPVADHQLTQMNESQTQYLSHAPYGSFNPYENYLPTQQSPFYVPQIPQQAQQAYQQFNQQAYQPPYVQPQYAPSMIEQQYYNQSPAVEIRPSFQQVQQYPQQVDHFQHQPNQSASQVNQQMHLANQSVPRMPANSQPHQQYLGQQQHHQQQHQQQEPTIVKPEPSEPRILQESTQNRPAPISSSTMKQPQQQTHSAQPANLMDRTAQYPGLLMTLADEYIEAARKLPSRSKQYYDLYSTAIGCMDLILRNFKLEPLREAQLRLKHAQILYDETNNNDEVEIVLTKGIDLCDNMKFIDLKYAMKSLLVKVIARSNIRAAMQDLKKLIEDVEVYRHTAWEYALRFQAVSLAANPHGQHSLHEAFHQLGRIQQVARLNNDHGIYAFASIIEAQLHLHQPGHDNVQLSQRAVAQARSLQLNPDVEKHPQMQVLMDIIDLIWSIIECNEKEISRKRQILKEGIYDKGVDHPNWAHDEAIWLRVNSSSLRNVQVQEGGLVHQSDGKYYLALSWIGKKELETIGFLLIGVALAPQNCQLKNKAVNFLQGGIPLVEEEMLDTDKMFAGKQDAVVKRCHLLCMHMKAETAFLLCAQGRWQQVKNSIAVIEKHMQQHGPDVPQEFITMLIYLKGCYSQGTGDLKRALEYYMSEQLMLRKRDPDEQAPLKMSTKEQIIHSYKLLAAMNAVLIVKSPNHPFSSQVNSLMSTISSNVSENSPQLIAAAYSIIQSSLPDRTMLELKQVLGEALKFARNINNNQIISLTLTLMQDKFFRGGVQSAQAISCAKAAAHQVRSKWGQPIWMVIADMMQLESLRLQPDPQDPKAIEEKRMDIVQKQAEMQQAWKNVPEGLREQLSRR